MFNVQRFGLRSRIYRLMREEFGIPTTPHQRIKMANYMLNNGIIICSDTLNLISYRLSGQHPPESIYNLVLERSLPVSTIANGDMVGSVLSAIHCKHAHAYVSGSIRRYGITYELGRNTLTSFMGTRKVYNDTGFWYTTAMTRTLYVIRDYLVYTAYYDTDSRP